GDNGRVTDSLTAPESNHADICLDCGFCCDGTLFGHAVSSDTPESLVALGLTPTDDCSSDRSGFRLPCPHFSGSCSIYASRPRVCANFRCRLLKSVGKGTYSVAQARQKVLEAKALRE